MKQFKKGDKVVRIRDWDRKGTVYITHWTVASWGAQQATLVSDDGKFLKSRIYTTDYAGIYLTGSIDEQAVALELAKQILAEQRAHFNRCLGDSDHIAYLNAIKGEVAALHEPRVLVQS